MKKFSFNSIIRKQQPKGVFIKAIWKSWHRHHLSISMVIGIARKFFLPSEFFFFQKESRMFMFFLVLSYGISIILLQIQILNSLRFPIHPVKGVHWCFKKTTAPKISAYFAYFPVKHPGLSFFLSTLLGFPGITPKSSLAQLFCRQGFIRAI